MTKTARKTVHDGLLSAIIRSSYKLRSSRTTPHNRILLVEDSKTNALEFRLTVNKIDPSVELDICDNWTDAVEKITNYDYRLLVVDWFLPEDSLNIIKQLVEFKVRVVIWSACVNEVPKNLGLPVYDKSFPLLRWLKSFIIS